MLKIAISGINGFIGKNLTILLDEKNIDYFSLDEFLSVKSGSLEEMKLNVPRFDVLIHLAARSFIPDSYNSPNLFYEQNFQTTLKCLELARKKGASFLYFSSYIYGRPMYLPVDEIHPLNPINTYSRSKFICEELCKGYSQDFNVPCIILRPFNIYGPFQKSNFLIPKIITEAISKKSVILHDPVPKRDFLHVKDLVEAVFKIVSKKFPSLEIYNLGSGESFSVLEVAQIVREFLPGISVSFDHEVRPSEVLETISDSSKFSSDYNWNPDVKIRNGIGSLIQETRITLNGRIE